MSEIGKIQSTLIESIERIKGLIGDENAASLIKTVKETSSPIILFRMNQELKETLAELQLEADPKNPIDTSFQVKMEDGTVKTFRTYQDFISHRPQV